MFENCNICDFKRNEYNYRFVFSQPATTLSAGEDGSAHETVISSYSTKPPQLLCFVRNHSRYATLNGERNAFAVAK